MAGSLRYILSSAILALEYSAVSTSLSSPGSSVMIQILDQPWVPGPFHNYPEYNRYFRSLLENLFWATRQYLWHRLKHLLAPLITGTSNFIRSSFVSKTSSTAGEMQVARTCWLFSMRSKLSNAPYPLYFLWQLCIVVKWKRTSAILGFPIFYKNIKISPCMCSKTCFSS